MRNALVGLAAFARRGPALAAGAIAVLLFFILQTTRFRWPGLLPVGDSGIVFEKSLAILQSGQYPARLQLGNLHDVFPYPPPAVAVFAGLAKLGAVAFNAVWLSLMAAGLFATFAFSVAYEHKRIRRAFLALMVPAIAIHSIPTVYDLANHNNNLILLGLAMTVFALARRHPIACGVLLALPIAMKLYLGLLLGWLAIYAPRAALACVAGLFGLWLVLPVAVFGPGVTLRLYEGWWEQAAIVSSAFFYHLPSGVGPPLVSLRRAAAWLTGSDPFSTTSAIVLTTFLTGWVLALSLYAWRAWRLGRVGVGSRAALADWTVLMLAPLPFSPWLEPYHAVPALVAVVVCLLMLFDDATDASDRATGAVAIGAVMATSWLGFPFEARGLVFLIQFVILTSALALMRPGLARPEVAAVHATVAGGCESTE